MIAKKNARLEAELERKNAELQRLEFLEAVSEFKDQAKDEQLRAKDAIIRELQTALDIEDRPSISGDVNEGEELETKIELLSGQVKDDEERTSLAIQCNLKEFKPFVEETVKRDIAVLIMRLSDREEEIQSLKVETEELRTLNDALMEEIRIMLDSCDEYMSSQIQSRKRLASASKQFEELISLLSEERDVMRNLLSQQAQKKAEYLAKLMEVRDPARRRIGTPLPQKPAKTSRSPAEIEMLRLKNRQTLHGLER